MSTDVCRSVMMRNATLSHLSNHSSITNIQLVINGISLIIFAMAFVGNIAALVVIFTPRGRTRLTNNTYLANLALADLLRTCFIPFTITARMKRNFIFGRSLCKILPIVQGKYDRFEKDVVTERQTLNDYQRVFSFFCRTRSVCRCFYSYMYQYRTSFSYLSSFRLTQTSIDALFPFLKERVIA